jgi:ATP-dependent DNA ligase
LVVLPLYTPTAPTLVRQPFHRDGWIYEEKVDGWRIVAYKEGDRVSMTCWCVAALARVVAFG